MDITYHLDPADLQDDMKKVFGTDYLVTRISKMHGGAQKVVYKLDCDNGFSCILYVWDLAMNYFQEEIENDDIHSRSYGGELFELNNNYLTERGIRTPALYDMNKERSRYPFDYALVEYVEGQKLDSYFNQPNNSDHDELFQTVGDIVAGMHVNERSTYGKVNQISAANGECHHLQMKDAKTNLSYIIQHMEDFKLNYSKLLDKLYELEARIQPRKRYGLIHGELGPDHLIINNNLDPYVIDIEGAEFFDIEHEHSFLQIRFGDYYKFFENDTLDPNRMLFYRYHHYISITAGFLKLLHRGFPNQQLAKSVIKLQSENALRFIQG